MRVGLVGIAGEVDLIGFGNRAEGGILGAVGTQGRLGGPLRDRFAERVAGQEILGQDHELDVLAVEGLRRAHLPADALDRRRHALARAGPVRAVVDGMAGDLQGEGPVGVPVGVNGFLHPAVRGVAGDATRSGQSHRKLGDAARAVKPGRPAARDSR